MSEKLNYEIIIGGNAYASIGDLKKALKESQAEVIALQQKFGETSEEANKAAQKTAQLNKAISDASQLTKAFNPDAKFRTLTQALSGVAGGFSALQGAIGVIGVESENLQKQLLKVQSALAISQGVETIAESIEAFKLLGATIQSTTLFQKLNAAANYVVTASLNAMGIAANTASLAFRGLKAALASTGILLVVVAIGELISALYTYTTATDKAVKKQKELNDTLAEQSKAANKAVKDFVKSQTDISILRAKLEGKSEEEIDKIRVEGINKQIAENNKRYEELLKTDKKAASELKDENAKLQDEITKIFLEGQINRKKKLEEDRKDDLDKIKEKNQKEYELLLERYQRESDSQKIQIEAFRSTLTERDRELLKAEDDFESKKGDLIRAGVTDFTLVQEQYRLKLIEINKKYDKEEEDKLKGKLTKEQEIKEINTTREVQTRELEAITLAEKRDAELFALSEDYRLKYELAVKNGEDLLLLREYYAAAESNINRKYVDEQKKIDAAGVQAKIATLNEISAVLGALSTLSGQQTEANRAFTLAQIGIDTAAAIASLTKNSEANPANSVTFGAAGGAQFAAGLVRILANIKKAKDLLFSKSISPSLSSTSVNKLSPVTPQLQQAQLTQLNQATINAIGNSAIRAYVVETDITSNQKRIQAIKQRARFS